MLTDSLSSARKHLNLEHLSPEECAKILQVLQKDFELRQKEKQRLTKIEEVLEEEEKKKDVIAKKTNLNENVCIRCCQSFGIIFNRKQLCQKCNLFICKSCCVYDSENKCYVCLVCIKELELKLQSCDWFYNNVSKKFKRFGSAKVVRSLYKQKSDRSRRFHSDNESDSGYDPSLFSSLRRRGSLEQSRHPLSGLFSTDIEDNGEEDNEEIEPVLPPPPQFDSSIFEKPTPPPVVPVKEEKAQEQVQVKHLQNQETQANQDDRTRDIYKEAFESTKQTEERKFRERFESLLSELQHSLQNQSPHGVTCNTSYGSVMVAYTNRLRELLVGVSQRLELAVDSFDSFSQSPTPTSEKVRQLVSKLVENTFGESIDLTSDEAVSDLSSLSDDDSENQKSFEDQLAQAIIGKVLENYRKDSGLSGLGVDLEHLSDTKQDQNSDVQLDNVDQGHGDSLQNSDIDQGQGDTLDQDDIDFTNSGHKNISNVQIHVDSVTQYDISHFDHGHPESLNREATEDNVDGVIHVISRDSNRLQYSEKSLTSEVDENLKRESVDLEESEVLQTEPVEERLAPEIAYTEESEPQNFSETVPENSKCVQRQDPEKEIQHLREFLSDISSRKPVKVITLKEEFVEEAPIEKVTANREESQEDFLTKYSSLSRVRETSTPLPSFDVCDFELNSNEVDPDLLSMNLAPIIEEDEEDYEEENEEENPEYDTKWKGNWIFRGTSGISPYDNMGRRKVGGDMGQVYLTIPQPYNDFSPKVGNKGRLLRKPLRLRFRDAEDCLSDLSEDEEDENENLSDEENTFYAKTSEEIARITRTPTLSRQASTSVQTDDSDLDTSKDRSNSLSDAGVKGISSLGESSADESQTKKKLVEELIPAEGDDPKFEIPPDSVTVLEGEPAKFMCRVTGTNPVDVYWYRAADDDLFELEDSEQFDIIKDGNRHHLTMYNPVRADAGQYMAIAINEKGKCCQYIILKVKKNTQELKAPEFIKGIQDLEVIEGQCVKFRCKVKGYPQPRVVWYKDGHKMKSSSNCKLEKYGNRDYILSIDCATLDEDAEYTVMAKNIAGEVKSSAQLIVEQEQPDTTSESRTSFTTHSWSSSFSDDRRLPSSTPTVRKDDQQLSNLGRKIMKTKENVTDVAEDMLTTANELSNLHRSLDHMDTMLSSFEKDVHPANNTDWSDHFLSHNLCSEAVESYTSMRNAAKNVRQATSSALNIINTTNNVIGADDVKSTDNVIGQNKEDIDECLATSTPRIESEPELLLKQNDHSNNNISESTNQKPLQDKTLMDNETLEKNKFTPEMDYPTNMSYNSQVTIIPRNVESSKDSENNDLSSTVNSSFSLSDDLNSSSGSTHEHVLVNTGPKRINSEQYNRDFYVNVTPKPRRRKWEVNTDKKSPSTEVRNRQQKLQDTEDKIYMTAGQVYHLEDKIQDLESRVGASNVNDRRQMAHLEDEVARTVAQVHHSEQDVSTIEKSVHQLQVSSPMSPRHSTWEDNSSNMSSPSPSIDSGFSSIRERTLQTYLVGHTGEDELPESRTELNEETGVELPSVNRLKAMFSHSGLSTDESSLKRKEQDYDGVHSITARNVPKEKLERYRKRSNKESNQDKQTSQMTMSLSHTEINEVESEPVQVFPKTKGSFFPEHKPPTSLAQSSEATSSVTRSQPIKMTVSYVKHDNSTRQASPLEVERETKRKSDDGGAKQKAKPKIRVGCIAARASFWEKKIQGDPNDVSIEEFPEMVEHAQE